MNTKNSTNNDTTVSNITVEQIHSCCRELTSKNEKVTGAKVRRLLVYKYGHGCQNGFLFDALRSYKKSLRFTKTEFDTDKLEEQLTRFDIPNLPKPINSLASKSFFYAVSIIADYMTTKESTELTSQLYDEIATLRESNEFLQEEILRLEAIVEYQTKTYAIPSNTSLNQLSNVSILNTSETIMNVDINTKESDHQDIENDKDNVLEPNCLYNGKLITVSEFQTLYVSFHDRHSLLQELLNLKCRLKNGHQPTCSQLSRWIAYIPEDLRTY